MCTEMPSALHLAPDDRARLRVSCAFIRCRRRMHDSDLEPEPLQAAGGLQTEKSSPDHDRVPTVGPSGVRHHGAGVVEGAEGEHSRQQRSGRRVQIPIGGRNERLPVAMISSS